MIKKTVLIIGASSDIGKASAKLFAKNGYNIIGTYNNTNIDNVINDCKALGASFLSLKLDVDDYENITNVFEIVRLNAEYLDCVIYLPGKSEQENLLCDYNVEQINKIIDINLKGAVLCNKEAMKLLIKQKHGSIINLSSIYGVYGGACETAYSAAKAGVIGLTKALAQECAPYNVRVNAVAPGFIETNMTRHFNAEEKEIIKQNTPLKRLGQPDDVANAIYFLASDNSSFITGEVLNVNGGAIKF